MKKWTSLLVVVFVGILLAIILIYSKGEVDKPNLTVFSFHYGSYNAGYYNYDITKIGESYLYVAIGQNGVELDIEKEISSKDILKLEEIISNHNIKSWDKFDENDKTTLDGNSFSLQIIYKDNKQINASGYMKYPSNYNEVHNELLKFFSGL